jgi:predicted restriction endonuclease
MNNWLISGNDDEYDYENAFAKLENNCIYQHQANNCKFECGDVVYIYCTPEQKIKYKCLILTIDVPPKETVNDEKYMLDKKYFENLEDRYKKFMRLQLFEKVNIELQSLKANGLKEKPLSNQQKIDSDLLTYLTNCTCIPNIDEDINKLQNLTKTEKVQLCAARIGQGLFRQRVITLDKKCIITGVNDLQLLIASHIKSWKESTNNERLDGMNGILLSPHLDKLFDKHLISFTNDGKIIVPNENIKDVLFKWNIDINKEYCKFTEERRKYLEYHREIFERNNGHCT